MKNYKISLLLGALIIVPGCQPPKQEQRETSFEGIKKRAELAADRKDTREAIESLEELVASHGEHRDIDEVKLKLADLYFAANEYDKADDYYQRIKQLDPQRAEYASYRSLLCAFYQTLSINRDPTPMKKTLERTKEFLDTPEFKNSMYRRDVRNIAYTCERKLIDREVYISNFYMRTGKFKSAQNRLDYIRRLYGKQHHDVAPRVAFLETKLAIKEKNYERAREKQQYLAQNFPKSPYVAMGTNIVSKPKHHARDFEIV